MYIRRRHRTHKRRVKFYLIAVILGFSLAVELGRSPSVVRVGAQDTPMSETTITATPTVTPTNTPTPTPTLIPEYRLENAIQPYKISGLQYEYAQYIWNLWAGHGNRLQAVAFCTNISEGHLDDNATGYNTDGTDDRGCWSWNTVHNLPDTLTRDCRQATDYTYAVWQKRMNLGVTDGFQGMWYGYGSKNYYNCLNILKNE
jgi:hypothetical protein